MLAAVTGGGSGIGLYAARALDANGAKAIYIVCRREATLNEAAKTAVNGNIIPVVEDVTDKTSLAGIADRVRKEHGFVNFLFANAGTTGLRVREYLPKKPAGEKPTVKEMQEALWKPEMQEFTNALHVNTTGAFYAIVAFLDLLGAGSKKHNVSDSQILVTSSVAAFSRNLASSFTYSASKAGVNHLVKMISTLCAQNRYHIRCNMIVPGIYPSEMTKGSMSGLEPFSGIQGHSDYFKDARDMTADKVPAERSGSEEDIAGAIMFLASRAGAYVNGDCLMTDGGRLATLPATY